MSENKERSTQLITYVELTLKKLDLDSGKKGELLMFGEAIRQFADNELGDVGLLSLIIHTQTAFMSDIPVEMVKGIYAIYGVDASIVDRLLNVDDEFDVDIGTTDFTGY